MDTWKENGLKYLPYLEDLRRHLYTSVLIFVSVFMVGFLSAAHIIKTLLFIVHIPNVTVATSSPFQFTNVAMDIGFFFGIMLTTPYILYSFYSFIAPALTKQEKRDLFRSIPISVSLFTLGFLYGVLVLYYALELLANINSTLGIQNIWNISEFLSQMFVTAALLGLVFELPLLLTLLVKMGILETDSLQTKRRIVYFLIFVLVSLLPPTDGLSLIAMALPLIVLYEVTILLNKNKQPYVWTR